MPRTRPLRLLTVEPPHTEAAIAEWATGIDEFIEWANRARQGDSSSPAAIQLDKALAEFSRGSFHVEFNGLAPLAVVAGLNIVAMVRDGDWHLATCTGCDQWFLAKDRRRTALPWCRRGDCVRAREARQKAVERQARRDLDRGLLRQTRRTF